MTGMVIRKYEGPPNIALTQMHYDGGGRVSINPGALDPRVFCQSYGSFYVSPVSFIFLIETAIKIVVFL